MISEHQTHFRRVQGDFSFFLCRIVFLLLMALSLAQGGAATRTPQPTRSGYATTYQLTAGWNLISINLNLDEASKALLQNKGAMALDANSEAYVISGNFAAPQACWLYCQTAEKLTLSGSLPENSDFAASLQPGWNFIGPLKDSLLSGAGSIAWGWQEGRFYPTDTLLAGHGYFLYLSESGQVAPSRDTYLVIDLSAGANATIYPVSYLSAPPPGGWTEEYKTTKLVLRKIPAGTFMMGSPANELERDTKETQHQVTLTRDFYTGVFEVTQKQWSLVMGSDDWPSYFSNLDYRDSRPVENVSYNAIRGSNAGSGWPGNNNVDYNSFLGKLRARTDLVFDLPTEAQWEYACRAGTTTALNSGKNLTGAKACSNVAELGRYEGNKGADNSADCDPSGGTATVGSYLPNQWGLYDMYGNVSEWCLDWWDNKDYPPQAVTDPKGDLPPGGGITRKRIQRSSSWAHEAHYCRSARRRWAGPDELGNTRGFRLTAVPAEDTYLVIDLSAGQGAASYPVSYRAAPPKGGWTDEYKTTKLVLRKIPAGTFMMGSPGEEQWRVENETQHQVTLTKNFYMGVFEVTQKQWERVMGNWPSYFENPDYRDSRPVEKVTYNAIRGSNAGSGWPANNDVDSGSFLGKLRDRTKLDFDLPTEAQWEYACRAGTTTALNSGKNLIANQMCPNVNEVGRYFYNGGKFNPADGDTTNGTAKVGSYLPNQWGLYDMHGNVREWCLDWWDGNAYSAQPVTDPTGDGAGTKRVVRGSKHNSYAGDSRSAFRDNELPNLSSSALGLRLAWPTP